LGSAAAVKVPGGDAVECGVALLIESGNAKANHFQELVDQLDPVIPWYGTKRGQLSAERVSKERALALMTQYQKDWKLRKALAKSCVHRAYEDPAFLQTLPQDQR
jgi:hypothetical protein